MAISRFDYESEFILRYDYLRYKEDMERKRYYESEARTQALYKAQVIKEYKPSELLVLCEDI